MHHATNDGNAAGLTAVQGKQKQQVEFFGQRSPQNPSGLRNQYAFDVRSYAVRGGDLAELFAPSEEREEESVASSEDAEEWGFDDGASDSDSESADDSDNDSVDAVGQVCIHSYLHLCICICIFTHIHIYM